jgi:hypothetical protein
VTPETSKPIYGEPEYAGQSAQRPTTTAGRCWPPTWRTTRLGSGRR